MEWHATSILDNAIALLDSLRIEIAIFCVALLCHTVFFGNVLRRSDKRELKSKARDSLPYPRGHSPPSSPRSSDSTETSRLAGARHQAPATVQQASVQCHLVFERSDHRSVVRMWNTLKREQNLQPLLIARVAESMQRLNHDAQSILRELTSYLQRNAVCDCMSMGFVNEILEPLAKSLDVKLVNGVLESLPQLSLKPDAKTYEILAQMHFGTRSHAEIHQIEQQIQENNVEPTARTSLVLLKTALHQRSFDGGLQHFKALLAGAAGVKPPPHLETQLVELAIHEHRIRDALAELESGSITCTPEILNILLESGTAKPDDLTERIRRIAREKALVCNGRTYQMLVRGANGNKRLVKQILEEVAMENRSDCIAELAPMALSHLNHQEDMALVERLYSLLASDNAVYSPTIAAFLSFFGDGGAHEEVCEIFSKQMQPRADDSRRSLGDPRAQRAVVAAAVHCNRMGLVADLVEAAGSGRGRCLEVVRSAMTKLDAESVDKVTKALQERHIEIGMATTPSPDPCIERSEWYAQLKDLLRVENFDGARKLLGQTKEAGVSPGPVAFNEAINAIVSSRNYGNRGAVWQIIAEMKKQDLRPNCFTCSILLKKLCAQSAKEEVDRTLKLIDDLAEPVDEVLLASIAEAYARLNKPRSLEQKLQELRAGERQVNVSSSHSFGSLIKACGQAWDIQGAWRYWEQMQKRCVTPSSITIGCMVEAVAANGDIEGGLKLVLELLEDPKTKDQINSVIYGSILKHYSKAQKVNRVFEVCDDMLRRGIQPSVITFNTLLDACARSGQMHRAPDLLADMEKRRLKPNIITFSTVIRGHCNKGDVSSATKSLEQARQHQVRLDEIVYNTLLEVYAKRGMSKEGLQLFEEMKKEGVSPNSFTMTMVARILATSADSKHTLSFVNEHVKRYRVKFDGLLSAALVDACLHSKDAVGAARLLQDMVRQGFQTPARKCELTLRQLLNQNQGQCAGDLLRMLLLGAGPKRSRHVQLDDKLVVDVLSGICSMGSKNVDAVQTLHADLSAGHVLGPQARLWRADSARSPKSAPRRRA